MRLLSLSILVVLCYGCCNVSSKNALVISWQDYTGIENPEQAKWFLNGEYVGKGNKGFLVILSKMENSPDGTEIYIDKEPFVETDSSWQYLPPCQKYLDKIERLVIKKDFVVGRLGVSNKCKGREGFKLFLE